MVLLTYISLLQCIKTSQKPWRTEQWLYIALYFTLQWRITNILSRIHLNIAIYYTKTTYKIQLPCDEFVGFRAWTILFEDFDTQIWRTTFIKTDCRRYFKQPDIHPLINQCVYWYLPGIWICRSPLEISHADRWWRIQL